MITFKSFVATVFYKEIKVNSSKDKLDFINKEIYKLGLAIKMCESHIQFISDMKQAEKDKYMTKDYESQMCQEAYRRMSMQDKMRKLMRESMELQDRLCMEID